MREAYSTGITYASVSICVRVTSGGTPSRRGPAYYAGGTWPWVKTQELQDKWIDDTEEHITEEAVASSSAKVLPAHTVLVAMYGATVGQLGILRRPMTCNQACSALIVNPAEADYRFLYFQLLQVRSQLKSLATGAAQQNLSGVLIKSLRLPFPPVEEQRAIAHILGTLDDKIELNRRMSETLEAMARALFKSWFVDFDPVRAKAEGRDPGLPKPIADLFPGRLVDSELGEIPAGWGVRPIGDLAEVVGGSTPKTERFEYWENGTHHWVTPKDLSGLSMPVLLDTERRITDAGLAQIGSGLLPIGTVLLSSRAPIGYLAVAEILVAINQGFIAVKPRSGISNLFLLRWASAAHDEIVSHANGSTFLEISKSSFRPIRTVAPTTPVMHAFDRMSRPMYLKVVEHEREYRTLAVLRDTLLPRLVSGELRVKDAENFIGRAV
ncbi:MAG: restriction endonuclease subunit S [Betaproteobacteria bacterium]